MNNKNTHVIILATLGVLLVAAPASAEIVSTDYISDALGSPVAATDETGAVRWREHHQPYGRKLLNEPANDEPTGFTGHRFDGDTGLVYMSARYYDPLLGRFMGMDSAEVSAQNIHVFNRYAYANNNPYSYVDPDGRDPVDALMTLRPRYGTQSNPGNARSVPHPIIRGIRSVVNAFAPKSFGEAAFDAVSIVFPEAKLVALVGLGIKGIKWVDRAQDIAIIPIRELRYVQGEVLPQHVDRYRRMIRDGKELVDQNGKLPQVVPSPRGPIIINGNHRSAALRAEGKSEIKVEVVRDHPERNLDQFSTTTPPRTF